MSENNERPVCSDCGRVIEEGEDYITTHDGRIVCRSGGCADEYEPCSDCGKYYKLSEYDEDHKYAGDWLCEECFCRDYVVCRDCGEVIRYDDAYQYDTEYLCDSCYNEGYFTCDDCGEVCANDDGREIENFGRICTDCYNRGGYYYCEGCDRYFRGRDGEWHGDFWYCDECGEERFGEEDCDGVMGYHDFGIGNYRCRYADGEKRGSDLTFGVELEVDRGTFDSEAFTRWTDDGNLLHFEHDGSLSSCGVECISQPCTLAFHQVEMGWHEICKEFKRQGFRSHDTSTCGLHVHIGRRLLTVTDIVKMDVWLNRWMLWRDTARRDSIFGGSYDDRKTIDISHGIGNSDDYNAKLSKYKRWFDHNERYQPLNTTNKATVEVRIFRGTLNDETILGTLEACHALCKFASLTPIKRVYDRTLPEKFLEYVADHKKLYGNVFPMLKRLAKVSRESALTMGIIAKNSPPDNPNAGES